jgi:hypothetical protein
MKFLMVFFTFTLVLLGVFKETSHEINEVLFQYHSHEDTREQKTEQKHSSFLHAHCLSTCFAFVAPLQILLKEGTSRLLKPTFYRYINSHSIDYSPLIDRPPINA